MTTLLITYLFFPLMCSVAAYVVANIITNPGMIAAPLVYFCTRYKVPEWISKPLLTCRYCIAGQYSLWLYLYLHWSDYNIITHIWVVCLAIFGAELLLPLEKHIKYLLEHGD